MKNNAPSAGPRKLRIPPITTIATNSTEFMNPATSGVMNPFMNASTLPATAA